MGVAQVFRLTQMRDLYSNDTFVIEIRNIIVRTEKKQQQQN